MATTFNYLTLPLVAYWAEHGKHGSSRVNSLTQTELVIETNHFVPDNGPASQPYYCAPDLSLPGHRVNKDETDRVNGTPAAGRWSRKALARLRKKCRGKNPLTPATNPGPDAGADWEGDAGSTADGSASVCAQYGSEAGRRASVIELEKRALKELYGPAGAPTSAPGPKLEGARWEEPIPPFGMEPPSWGGYVPLAVPSYCKALALPPSPVLTATSYTTEIITDFRPGHPLYSSPVDSPMAAPVDACEVVNVPELDEGVANLEWVDWEEAAEGGKWVVGRSYRRLSLIEGEVPRGWARAATFRQHSCSL